MIETREPLQWLLGLLNLLPVGRAGNHDKKITFVDQASYFSNKIYSIFAHLFSSYTFAVVS